MKKTIICLSVFILILSLTACSGDKKEKKTSSGTSNIEQSAVVDTESKTTKEYDSDTVSGEQRKNKEITATEAYKNETATGQTSRDATSNKSEKAFDKTNSSSDSTSTKKSTSDTSSPTSATSSTNSSTTSSSAWTDGQRLPDMPIE